MDASSVSQRSLADWMTDLCIGERGLQWGTISAYRSGLRAWWIAAIGPDSAAGCDPFGGVWLQRVMQGIQRTCDTRTAAQRADRPVTPALTPELLGRLKPSLLASDTPMARMVWAACLLGVHAVLRVGELLGPRGTATEPGTQFLRREQIRFYACPITKAELRPARGEARVPAYLTVNLGATKTDTAGRNAPKVCAHEETVRTLWSWACELPSCLGDDRCDPFFATTKDGSLRHLRARDVMSALELAHENARLGSAHFTGKCFRRGLTSELMARGAPTADVQLLGGWKGAGMPAVYTDREALFQRQIRVSRGGGAPPAAAGNGAWLDPSSRQ